MGCCKTTCAILAVLAAYVGYNIYQILFTVPPIPSLPKDQWWGPGYPPKTLDTSVRPFKVESKPEKINQLKERLNGTSWLTEPLEDVGFQYGFNTKYLKEVAEFWRTKYDFAEREKKLNSLPQFKTNIQGLDIHFVHVTQPNPKKLRVVPLLLLHGWPGSYVEFYNMISELASEEYERHDFVFNIVVPSLPGFGYSEGTSKTGLGASQISVIMANLMERLGYSTYVIQGGDWGSTIGATLSILYPERVIGFHTNMAFIMTPMSLLKHFLFGFYPTMLVDEKYVSKMYPIESFFINLIKDSGFVHLQATKPDTMGVALKDSPLGLAAYILTSWTKKEWRSLPDGGITKKYDLTELLDNVMVYWDSGCITTSMRLYSESFSKAHLGLQIERIPVKIPVAVVRCSNEIFFLSKYQLKEKYENILRFTDFEDAGHFTAFEEPKMMARDIWTSVEEFKKFNKKTSVKNDP